MRASGLVRTGWLSSTAVLLLSVIACGSPSNNSALFGSGAASAGSAGYAMSSASAGSGGTGIPSAGSGAGGSSSPAGGSANGAAGGLAEDGGSGGVDIEPPAQGGGAGALSAGAGMGGGGGGGANVTGDCTAHAGNATYYSQTHHCYLVDHDLATYADSQAHCASLGAHLLTIANQDENDFAWSLDAVEHWIGASDGKGPKQTDPGTYTWLTGEPFDFTAWSDGQPNASKTSCGDANGGGDCYEHCAFQWTGGQKDGQWNDRYCLHTIESICEWDN